MTSQPNVLDECKDKKNPDSYNSLSLNIMGLRRAFDVPLNLVPFQSLPLSLGPFYLHFL